jgi:hypothetical protein
MTASRSTGVLLAALALLVGAEAGGQPGPGRGGPGAGGRIYDPKTVETVAGEVASVSRDAGTGRAGVHLTLRTEAGSTLSVRLGPASWVDRQPMTIATGDRIQVTGSRVTAGGDTAIVAREVRKGKDTLRLRNEAGVPAWRGGGRRGASR